MSHYRKIDVKIHNDAKFLSLSTLLSRQIFLTLLSHPDMLGMGAMRFSVEGLRCFMNTSLPPENKALPKAFREAFEEVLAKGLLKASEEDAFLYLPNFLKYNRPENANVMKGWLKVWDLLPECGLKIEVFNVVKAFREASSKAFQKDLGEGFMKALAKGLPKAVSSEQLTEALKDPPIVPQGGSDTESPPVSSSSEPKPPKKPRKTSWPYEEGYQITTEMREYALKHGVFDPNDEFMAWKIDCLANGRAYADWNAAWQNRCRHYIEFSMKGKSSKEKSFDEMTPRERDQFFRDRESSFRPPGFNRQ